MTSPRDPPDSSLSKVLSQTRVSTHGLHVGGFVNLNPDLPTQIQNILTLEPSLQSIVVFF